MITIPATAMPDISSAVNDLFTFLPTFGKYILCGILAILLWLFVALIVYVLYCCVCYLAHWIQQRAERARELYDNTGLKNELLLHSEQTFERFKRWVLRLYFSARYNWYTDRLTLIRHELRIWYDRVLWFALWRAVPLAVAIAAVWATFRGSVFDAGFRAWPGLGGQWTLGLPDYLVRERKWEGSNSHFRGKVTSVSVHIWTDSEWPATAGYDTRISAAEPVTHWITVTPTPRMYLLFINLRGLVY